MGLKSRTYSPKWCDRCSKKSRSSLGVPLELCLECAKERTAFLQSKADNVDSAIAMEALVKELEAEARRLRKSADLLRNPDEMITITVALLTSTSLKDGFVKWTWTAQPILTTVALQEMFPMQEVKPGWSYELESEVR